jgi:beta-glucosidase-like glycosyl hydrolase
MKDNTKLLEERVGSAVRRLKELSEDRKRLELEVRTVQTRLDRAESERLGRENVSPATEEASNGWPEQRAAIIATLKETIADLRSD